MAGFEELLVSIVSDFDDAGFKKLDRSTSMAEKATLKLSNSLKGLFVGIIGNIGVREIVDATVKMDSLRTSMNALAGSEVGGAEQIKFLREETNRLGQDFITTANAYKNLFSAGKGAGMSDSAIQGIFSGVLEAGTVLGSSPQQMQGALTALEQMISKGKVSTQELRLQLGNALPGAMQIAARAMKVTNKEFQKMLESGLDSQKFVIAFARQLHEEFGSKATEASHTLRAELTKLNNAVFDLKVSFLDGDAGKAFADVIRQLTEVLKSEDFNNALQGISKGIAFLIENWKLLAHVMIALGISKFIRLLMVGARNVLAFTKTTIQITRMISRFGALNVAMRLFARVGTRGLLAMVPVIGDIVLGIWLVVDAIKAVINWWKKLHGLTDKKEKKKDINLNTKPMWITRPDGITYDANPNSESYVNPAIFGGAKSGTNNHLTNNNSFTFNIKGDNPQQIAYAVRREMLNVFDGVNMSRGYMPA